MSHPSRPQARGPAQRRRRQLHIEPVQRLEERQLLAPFVSTNAPTVTFTAATTPTNANLGTVTVTPNAGAALATSAAAYTSVSELTPNSSFGGDIVRIKAGPGGDFGKGVYAISRGAGENTGAVNRPGVIYRVDPATGKSSVFFDLNTVISQIEPGGTAANSAGASTGLVNWYDIAFDPEGYFDGRPSMFVTSIDRTDPNKNAIFRIGPDGSYMGAFISFTNTGSGAGFTFGPSSILVAPPEQQTFLRGLVAGTGFNTGPNGFAAVFFNANVFRPGTNLSTATAPPGAETTSFTFGPQVGLTAASLEYPATDYSAFTNFGTPGAGGIPAQPGLSGVQDIDGRLLINGGLPIITDFKTAAGANPDKTAAIITPFRRFEDITYDQYGYFSYGTTLTVPTTAAGGNRPQVANQVPTYVANLFVSDLAPGLTVTVTPLAPLTTTPINVPVQGSGTIGVTTDAKGNVVPVFTNGSTTGGNIGGRIVRISPTGVVTNFAEGFHTSGDQTANSFIQSDLSITFSADGTILYAADDDGIWQFKTVTDLASSTTGSLVGLNDLRSLGVPYEGQDSAVAVVDTGVDVLSPPLRGRVSNGFNTLNGGFGNDDQAAGTLGTAGGGGGGAGGGGGVGGGGGGGGGAAAATASAVGHGTPVAGIITQFVPQITIDPINIFTPNLGTTGTTGGTPGVTATNGNQLYSGLKFITANPFVKDPVRPNTQNRLIAANFGFGTTSAFDTEGSAYKSSKQLIISLKNQLKKFRSLGIAPIAAAGQFSGVTSTTAAATANVGDVNGMSLPAVLNEVISVTGSYPFPYTGTATTDPTNPGTGVVPRPVGPVLLFGNGTVVAGLQNPNLVTADGIIFKDKILVSSNRGLTTDYTAPEIDVPTFSRTFTGDAHVHNVFNLAGTSYASAVVTGSYALVASAIDYWSNLAKTGSTVDAYLTQPVGSRTLNYGAHQLLDLTAYSNPDSINSILQWTAVPVTDAPNAGDGVLTKPLFGGVNYREYSRVSVSNAIAAIEGSVAINYLTAHNDWTIIDANHDGLITAAEIQTFVDNAQTIGLPEAGAMARLLGGTARIPTTGFQTTAVGELPDQPDVLQRRFNFFDFAANGSLKGAIPITAIPVLAKNLLPAPDAFVITDRQRSSINGYLLDPQPRRTYSDLQHVRPTYAFVPAGILRRYRNISPAQFGIGKKQIPGTYGPFFTLFGEGGSHVGNTQFTKATTTDPNALSTNAGASGSPSSQTTTRATGATTAQTAVNTQASKTAAASNATTANPAATSTAQGILNALTQIAQGNRGTSAPTTSVGTVAATGPGSPQPAGTLASESPAANQATAATVSSSSPSTTTTTAATTAAPGTGGTAHANATTAAPTSRVAASTATTPAAHSTSKKNKGFFTQLYNNVSRLWGHKTKN